MTIESAPSRMTGQARRARRRRPRSVTLLALGVLSIAIIHLVRFVMALRQWDFLASILPIPPGIIAASGLVWALVGAPLAWITWRGKRQAPAALLLGFVAYSLYYWCDRLGLGRGEALTNWPFAAAVNLLVLGWLSWVLTRRNVKAYFGEMHGPESENATIT